MSEQTGAYTEALSAVMAEVQWMLQNQGSLAPVAFVLADEAGARLMMVSLASRSEAGKLSSIGRVQAAVAAYAAVAVVWAQEGWLPTTAGREPGIVAELQTARGDWFRLTVPVGEDDEGAPTFDQAAAVAATAPYAGEPLFAAAFPAGRG